MKLYFLILAAIFTGDSGTVMASHPSKFHGLGASTSSLTDHTKKKNRKCLYKVLECTIFG